MIDWREDTVRAWELLQWEGELQWFAKRGDGVLGGRLRNITTLMGTIRNAELLGWNLYLNVNPSRERRGAVKLSRHDITHWRYIVVDLDPTAETGISVPEFNPVAHRLFSGRGFQCWVPVWNGPSSDKKLIESNDPKYEQIMAAYLRYHKDKDWTNGWQIDTSCADLARVVRCPGSINQKTGKRAQFEFTLGSGKTIGELMTLKTVVPERLTPIENNRSLADVMPHLSVTARRFLLEGANTPGRHSAAFHTAKSLHELGVPFEVAYKWIRDGGTKCQNVDSDLIMDISKMTKRVYGV